MNKVDEFEAEFRNWLKENGLKEDLKIEFWNIDTSYPFYLQKLLNNAKRVNKFRCINRYEITKDNLKNSEIKYVFDGNYNAFELSYGAIQQTIRVGIFFGLFDLDDSFFDYRSTSDFFVDCINGSIELNYKDSFSKYDNLVDYLFENVNSIKSYWSDVFSKLNKKSKFMLETFSKNLSNLYLSNWIFSNKVSNNDSIIIADKYKSKANTVAIEIINFLKRNNSIAGAINSFITITDAGNVEVMNDIINDNKHIDIGYAGEIIFNYVAEHKQLFQHLFNKNELNKIKFEKIEWTSQLDKYSPYDFRVDGFATFEVKATERSSNKTQFILSSNEWDYILSQMGRGYVCFLKSISLNWINYENLSIKDPEIINDDNFKIYTLNELKNQFEFNSRGFYVREK